MMHNVYLVLITLAKVVMEGGSATVAGAVAGAVFGALAGYRWHRKHEFLFQNSFYR